MALRTSLYSLSSRKSPRMTDNQVNSESPPVRSTILSSFLRGRPRGASQSMLIDPRDLSPTAGSIPQSPPSPGHRRRNAAPSPNPGSQTVALPSSVPTGLGLGHMLRRRRSAGNVSSQPNTPIGNGPSNAMPPPPLPAQSDQEPATSPTGLGPSSATGTHRIRLVPHVESRRSLRFDPIVRTLKAGDQPLRIGRFTDRSGLGPLLSANSSKIAFRSKVVSRAHAEIWVDKDGKFYIKDTKSSSGTFLNHVRLSNAGVESRQHQIKDGDVLQLGVDYQGGTEDIYKSVKMRLEIGRDWQRTANAFNMTALKNLKSLAAPVQTSKSEGATKHTRSTTIPDCCICLFPVAIRQALFLAPCSHTFHYKCIRPMLLEQHPAFSCPLCRTFADLDEDVEVDDSSMLLANDEEEEAAALAAVAEHISQHELAPEANGIDSLAPPRVETGAETEVEGDSAGGLTARPRRTNGRVAGVPASSSALSHMEEQTSEEEAADDMMVFEEDVMLAEGLMHGNDRDSQEDGQAPEPISRRNSGLEAEAEGSASGSRESGMNVDDEPAVTLGEKRKR